MLTITVDIHDASFNLSDLLSQVLGGAEVILTEDSAPVGRLTAVPAPGPRVTGLFPNSVWMSDDFDTPLPDEFWVA